MSSRDFWQYLFASVRRRQWFRGLEQANEYHDLSGKSVCRTKTDNDFCVKLHSLEQHRQSLISERPRSTLVFLCPPPLYHREWGSEEDKRTEKSISWVERVNWDTGLGWSICSTLIWEDLNGHTGQRLENLMGHNSCLQMLFIGAWRLNQIYNWWQWPIWSYRLNKWREMSLHKVA